MSKQKFYVVWNGVNPGIYDNWAACKQQISGVQGALYKSFDTREEAEQAYASPAFLYINKGTKQIPTARTATNTRYEPVSLAVDAACSGNPGAMEYRGVYVDTREQVFHFGPIQGTNNIGEFLALVHGLALLKQKGLHLPIYTDSNTALAWVRARKCKTSLVRNAKTEEVHRMIERAECWLQNNTYDTPVYKWDTEAWGEIPADFGRK